MWRMLRCARKVPIGHDERPAFRADRLDGFARVGSLKNASGFCSKGRRTGFRTPPHEADFCVDDFIRVSRFLPGG
jgi:hypothetical protein